MDKTSTEILLEAAALLEAEGKWHRGGYFYRNNKGCSMCAHGAIAYCGNPDLQSKIDSTSYFALPTKNYEALDKGVSLGSVAEKTNSPSVSEAIASQYGQVAVAHYRARKAGLSFEFNDRTTTTKQQVIDKLREAAQLP